MSDNTLISIKNVHTHYGRIPMLIDVSLDVHKGHVCCVLGANGAGKSTLVKTILGMVNADGGSIAFEGQDITDWSTHKRIAAGIQVASASIGTFPKMTVETNLRLGAYTVHEPKVLAERLEEIYESFPILKSRLQQKAGTLSGGERTMLSIARAVINKPHLLIMDEPSLGLAPIIVDEVFRVVKRLNQHDNISIMLVEQNANKALSVSQFGYIIQKGQILFAGEAEAILKSEFMQNPIM
ncbi:MAG: ABC transporter ATP-binding protein [Christensenellaceae bacterium]|jgi:branched-chain amino acid transport system ATP-binding protein|nr:ABC transporter ATP-binding protein [Christensenellaceae bacterium]